MVRYMTGWGGTVLDKHRINRCQRCGAYLDWHDTENNANTAWSALMEWKDKNKPKLDWDKVGPIHITVRAGPNGDDAA